MVSADDALIAVDASTLTPTTLSSGYRGTTDLVFDGQTVYSTNATDGTITAFLPADSSKRIVATGQSQPTALTVTASGLYWIDAGSSSVMMLPIGCTSG